MTDFTLEEVPELDAINEADVAPDDENLVYDASVGVVKRVTKAQARTDRTVPINSVASFAGIDLTKLTDRQAFFLVSFGPSGSHEGGPLYWDENEPRTNHDGRNVFSPTVPAPADFDSASDVQNYLDGVGDAFPGNNGCFIRAGFDQWVTPLPDITSLSSLNTAALVDGQQFYRLQFWDGTGVGGAPCYWDANRPVSEHNGGTIVDPARVSELNPATKEFNDYFTPDTVSGNTGCFVTVDADTFDPEAFGAFNATLVEAIDAATAASQQVISVAPRDADKNAAVFYEKEMGDVNVPSGQFGYVNYVTAHLPDLPGLSNQRDFVAYSFRLTTDHADPEGGDIRGIKGNCIGIGGAANIRGGHLLASGDEGHTGDLTGLLAVVDHADGVDGEPGSIGTAIGVIASLGAKTTSGFEVRSYAGTQRPAFGYRIATGGNAVLPEGACYQAHGGGNGALFRGFESESDFTITYEVTNKGHTRSLSYDSGQATIDDDDFFEITPPANSGMIEFFAEATAQSFGKFYFRVTGTALAQEAYSGSIVSAVSGSVPTGTTGVDGEITLFADTTTGKLYIENRSNGQRSFVWNFTARATYK